MDVGGTAPSHGSDVSVTMSGPHFFNLHWHAYWTATITNSGGAPSGEKLSESMPASLNGLAANARKGSCSISGSTIACDIGAMADGETVTVTVCGVTSAVGSITNTATVSSTSTDRNTGNNTASATANAG